MIRTIIKRLRRKLGDDPRTPTYIFTKPNVGYSMARDQELEEDTPVQ